MSSDLGYTTGREVESSIDGEIIHGMNATVNGVHDMVKRRQEDDFPKTGVNNISDLYTYGNGKSRET